MGSRLQQAFAEAARLPQPDQDSFAEFLLSELRDEQEWRLEFGRSCDVLTKLAEEARTERAEGRLEPIEELFK